MKDFFQRHWFALTSGLVCIAYALFAMLTVIPNQDILADAIQAQSLITDPRIVLAFPGQKHGGPLEYPATILAEWIFPGNYFANGLVRPIIAFFIGFITAKLFVVLFQSAPKWAFLLSVVAGPTVMHGLIGSEDNPVGVWWLQPNWVLGWLFTVSGGYAIAMALKSSKQKDWSVRITYLAGGLLIGLGFYSHPAIILLTVPLMVLVLLRNKLRIVGTAIALAGALLGVIPAAISYVVNAQINTWDPSHGAFISLSYYRSVGIAILGLDGRSEPAAGLLPFGFGLPPSTEVIPGGVQSYYIALLLALIILGAVLGIRQSIKSREPLGPLGAVSISWLALVATQFLFVTFINPVWLYSASYTILFWLTVGAIPILFTPRWLAAALASLIIAVEAFSMVSHNSTYFTSGPSAFSEKIRVMDEQMRIARVLESEGIYAVFGSYYDAIPIGYASGSSLRTLTNRYNRFPLTESELKADSIRIAINGSPIDEWGEESLLHVQQECSPSEVSDVENFEVWDCPPVALVFNK